MVAHHFLQLHQFLQSRERGALLVNADYRPPNKPEEPALDWLTFDDLQHTRDKIMQESVAFYDPAIHVIVFVFLPSQSGRSVAMWRRKINVPNNLRLTLQPQISISLSGLRREQNYLVHVDEYVPYPLLLERCICLSLGMFAGYPRDTLSKFRLRRRSARG
jgi:hypothetical protein